MFSTIKTMKWERSKHFRFRSHKEASGELIYRCLFFSLSLLLWRTVSAFLSFWKEGPESRICAMSPNTAQGELSFLFQLFLTCAVGSGQWEPDWTRGCRAQLSGWQMWSPVLCALFFTNCFSSRTNVITGARTDVMTEFRSYYYKTKRRKRI